MSNPRPILFVLNNAPGDSVVLTGAVRDLVLQHSDKFRVSVSSNAHPVWANNPYVKPPVPECQVFDLDYQEEMSRGNHGPRHTHFLKGFHNLLSGLLNVDIVPTLPRPDLHLLPTEKQPVHSKPYWVIFPGFKRDIPLKAWSVGYWQQLIDQLAGWGISCVQVGRNEMINPTLHGVESLVGKTGLRDLFALIRDSAGVICGVTQGIHIAAALQKPCVVIAGGRESWWWEAYVNENEGFGPASGKIEVPHRFLHTIGMFPCCSTNGCHRMSLFTSRRHKPEKVCTQQVGLFNQNEAACMAAIKPDRVKDAVLSYYLDGTIKPHNQVLEELVLAMPHLPAVDKPISILRADGTTLEINAVTSPNSLQTTATITPKIPLPKRPPVEASPALDAIGGRLTFCILMYGDFPSMHRRCIDSILETTPAERAIIRVGGNQLGEQSIEYLTRLEASGDIQLLDLSPDNRRKYPVMRRLFHDTPITTPWTLWFDDDTFCDVKNDWLQQLAVQIAETKDPAIGCHGPLYYYPLTPKWKEWAAQGTWYKNRPWQHAGTRTIVNFASGSFWAIKTEAIYACDIPDARIGHNKGDVTIGCQLHQGGYRISRFSQHKDVVRWSAVERRGVTEDHQAET